MKVELIGFGEEESRKIERAIRLFFPKTHIIHHHGTLRRARAEIEIKDTRHLRRASEIHRLIRVFVGRSGCFVKRASQLRFSRTFQRKKRAS